jgi:hypothetical protein
MSDTTTEAPADAVGEGTVNSPWYDLDVQLTGGDGNAFAILGGVQKALRRAGVPAKEISRFQEEATSGDYDHLLQTAMCWVNVS